MVDRPNFDAGEIWEGIRKAHPLTEQLLAIKAQVPRHTKDILEIEDPDESWKRFNAQFSNRRKSEHKRSLKGMLAGVVSQFQTTRAFQVHILDDIFEGLYQLGIEDHNDILTSGEHDYNDNDNYYYTVFSLLHDYNKPELSDPQRGKFVETRCYKLEVIDFLKWEDAVITEIRDKVPNLAHYGTEFEDEIEERRKKIKKWGQEYEEKYGHRPLDL